MTETTSATTSGAAAGAGGVEPRTGLGRAVALAGTVLAAVRPEQLGDPTPCPDYTVRQLADHLIAVLRRVAATGRGGDPRDLPGLAEGVTDARRAAVWADAAREAVAAWSDPAVLDRPLRAPHAVLPGAAVALVYTAELTVHTWDLAAATGQRPAWDPEVLGTLLAARDRVMPAGRRGGPVPFGPVVDVPADAPAADRLAAWYGRRPPGAR
ncbi:TIGR03086 family metal-binding protein [Streptomyces sp. TRM 70361]|uniref:TIGR03086 family metal-binding protein n=1 Tax=Streptomyces sp. TRM 70361 TaxID=3116553 RepID=UPI002E7AD50B|nr:TIGR03086 family metal-binding protein [Streptomyces sp. TRM 70361]MEE1942702.1 TIGR03086 family metal-binding protein [Streptomyces sp. TRM 70361]